MYSSIPLRHSEIETGENDFCIREFLTCEKIRKQCQQSCGRTLPFYQGRPSPTLAQQVKSNRPSRSIDRETYLSLRYIPVRHLFTRCFPFQEGIHDLRNITSGDMQTGEEPAQYIPLT